jgi:hypothetical protein
LKDTALQTNERPQGGPGDRTIMGCSSPGSRQRECIIPRINEFSGPWTLQQQVDMHVSEEGKEPSLGSTPLIPVSVSVGIRRAWRPLHILDALLQGLATNRLSMLHFKIIVLIIPSPLYGIFLVNN